MVAPVNGNKIASLQQTLRQRGMGKVLVIKPGQATFKGVESLKRLPNLYEKLAGFISQKFGIQVVDILSDVDGLLPILAADPSFMERISNSGGNLEVLGHTVVWEMEGENSGKLYLLKNDDNIRLVSPTTFISGQLILTPQEILQMYTRGEMPPVRSMVLIPGGEFLAGNPFKDEGSEAEKPVHTVEISPFFISPYPVTNGEYRTFMVAGGYANNELWSAEGRKYREESRTVKPSLWGEARFNDQNQPVIGVSWHEASAYLKWAGLRLPTEHEWEYAARGGLQYKRYPWGDETPMGRAHFGYSRNTGMPIAVDRREFVPNGFGLYQMAGNVSEWVLDWYAEDYYQQLKAAGTAINPKGPIEGKDKILRGGSWHQEAYFLRTACRSFISPDGWNYGLGFRAAMNYKPEEK